MPTLRPAGGYAAAAVAAMRLQMAARPAALAVMKENQLWSDQLEVRFAAATTAKAAADAAAAAAGKQETGAALGVVTEAAAAVGDGQPG